MGYGYLHFPSSPFQTVCFVSHSPFRSWFSFIMVLFVLSLLVSFYSLVDLSIHYCSVCLYSRLWLSLGSYKVNPYSSSSQFQSIGSFIKSSALVFWSSFFRVMGLFSVWYCSLYKRCFIWLPCIHRFILVLQLFIQGLDFLVAPAKRIGLHP